jgi:DNA-binding NarL/FixJ family response regulator
MSDALTPREREVLAGLAQGKPNKEIARELGIAEQTVKAMVSQVLLKLGVRNRTEAAISAMERGELMGVGAR